MVCPKCQSTDLSLIPAEVRLYRNPPRTLSHPPMNPSPEILVCLDCGWAEFAIPLSWLAAGWLRPVRRETETPHNVTSISSKVMAAAS
jgi:hypothetical protein